MRRDIEHLLRPLEQAKRSCRRAVLRSRFALVSLAILIMTTALFVSSGAPFASACLLACGITIIGHHIRVLARLPDPVSPGWLHLAVECRLTAAGRAALTPLLMADHCSCDDACAWARAERARPLDAPADVNAADQLVKH